jgi:mediator of RNA polymerase II transcription subunit 17
MSMILAPPAFRRRAVGQLPTASASRDAMIVFVHTARTRLRVTLVRNGRASHNSFAGQVDDLDTLDGVLRNAQHALVEHELFAALVREAGALPSVSARVSEQVIALEAASGTELRLELVSFARHRFFHCAALLSIIVARHSR